MLEGKGCSFIVEYGLQGLHGVWIRTFNPQKSIVQYRVYKISCPVVDAVQCNSIKYSFKRSFSFADEKKR